MGSKKTYAERIEELQKKQQQLKEQEKTLLAKKIAEDRKKRTRRLIQIGGAVESVFRKSNGDDAIIEESDIGFLIKYLQSQEDHGKYFSKAILDGRANVEDNLNDEDEEEMEMLFEDINSEDKDIDSLNKTDSLV